MTNDLEPRMTQLSGIRSWLEEGKSITPIQALSAFGCFRLGARIWELRNKFGMDIEMRMVDSGKGSHYAEYRLKDNDNSLTI